MATIMKYSAPDGDTRWRVRWRENGKQKSKTFDRQKLAKDFHVKIENSMRDGSYVSPSKTSVKEFLDSWIVKHEVKLAPSTAKRYKSLIARANEKIGGQYLQRLSPGHVQDMYSALGKDGLSGTTLLQMHRILSRAFKDAIRNRLIDKNPCAYVDTPRKSKFSASIVHPDDIAQHLSIFEGHYINPAVCLGLFCGLRLSEILALQWEDIDFKNQTLHVNHSIYWEKDAYILLLPKSKQKRVVPLNSSMIQMLMEHRTNQKKQLEFLWSNYQRSPFVVTYPDGRLIKPYNLSKQHQRMIAKTKFKGIRFHDLRHTAASLMLLEGEDLKTVSQILGHSTIAITADIYVHIIEEQKRTALNRLEKYMTPSANLI